MSTSPLTPSFLISQLEEIWFSELTSGPWSMERKLTIEWRKGSMFREQERKFNLRRDWERLGWEVLGLVLGGEVEKVGDTFPKSTLKCCLRKSNLKDYSLC